MEHKPQPHQFVELYFELLPEEDKSLDLKIYVQDCTSNLYNELYFRLYSILNSKIK